MKEVLGDLQLEPLGPEGLIDSGAEEELFRRLGQEAAKAVLAQAILHLRTLHRNGIFEQYWEKPQAVGF